MLRQGHHDGHQDHGSGHGRWHQKPEQHVTHNNSGDDARVARADAIDYTGSKPTAESRALHGHTQNKTSEHQPQGAGKKALQHDFLGRHRQHNGEDEENHRHHVLWKSAGGPQADGEHGEAGGDGHRRVAGQCSTGGHGDGRGDNDSSSSAGRRYDHDPGLTMTARHTGDALRGTVVDVCRPAHAAAIVANGVAADGEPCYRFRSGRRQLPLDT